MCSSDLKVRLAGDLGGTADAPTVPGLAGKSDVGHTHVPADVDGLDAVIATVDAATYQPDGSTLMRRTSSGRVSVSAPSEAAHAANKQYVDQALLTKVDTTSTGTRLYGTNAGGNQTLVQYASSATANTIPYRATGGTLQVGEPTSGDHAATKAYVDGRSGTSDKITHTYEGTEAPLSAVLDALLDAPGHAVVDTLPSNAADYPNTIFYVKE